MTIDTKFAAATANGHALLTADEVATVNGGLAPVGEETVYPCTPAPQGTGAMGMKNNWVASRTNDRKIN